VDWLVALQEIFAMVGDGSLQLVLDEIVPLEDPTGSFSLLGTRHRGQATRAWRILGGEHDDE
jgi:hypothetical protein